MAKGWTMPKEKCPKCGRLVFANWMIQHIRSGCTKYGEGAMNVKKQIYNKAWEFDSASGCLFCVHCGNEYRVGHKKDCPLSKAEAGVR